MIQYITLIFMPKKTETNYHECSTIKSYPKHPYQKIKEAILGKRYDLTLTFVGPERSQTLNQTYRNKSYTPNVLSFPLDEKTGEIYICPKVAFSEAHQYNLTKEGYVAFLFIHGCLHLKGHKHGATMEAQERTYTKKFKIV